MKNLRLHILAIIQILIKTGSQINVLERKKLKARTDLLTYFFSER